MAQISSWHSPTTRDARHAYGRLRDVLSLHRCLSPLTTDIGYSSFPQRFPFMRLSRSALRGALR